MRRLILDATVQIARLSGWKGAAERVSNAIRRELEKDPELILCTTHVAYREFLCTLVADIVRLRDLVISELHLKGLLKVSCKEIEMVIEKEITPRPNLRGAMLVFESVRQRFEGKEKVRTRDVIRFLDNEARDYRERRFFQVHLGNQVSSLPREGEDFINGVDCLSAFALRSRESRNSRCLCRMMGDKTLCSDSSGDPCLDGTEQPIRCCSSDPEEQCRLEAFVEEGPIAALLARLHEHVELAKFSEGFVASHEELLSQLAELRNRSLGGQIAFKGAECATHFTPLLMLLECGSNARLISFEPVFDELGAAIGQPDVRVNPGAT